MFLKRVWSQDVSDTVVKLAFWFFVSSDLGNSVSPGFVSVSAAALGSYKL